MATPAEIGLIIVGNSGVGKSFLANVILDEEKDAFEHKFKPTAVTTKTESKMITMKDGTKVSIFNIPGLVENNQEAIERNKTEIGKAFIERPFSIILYVFGNNGGRILDEDTVAFQALDSAYELKRESLCFLVNDLPKKRTNPNYEAETTLLLKELLKIDPIRVGFTSRLDDTDDKKSAERKEIRNTIMKMIEQLKPNTHVKVHDIQLNADKIKTLKAEMKEEREKMQKEVASMTETVAKLQSEINAARSAPAREIHHYHTTTERSGGCLVM